MCLLYKFRAGIFFSSGSLGVTCKKGVWDFKQCMNLHIARNVTGMDRLSRKICIFITNYGRLLLCNFLHAPDCIRLVMFYYLFTSEHQYAYCPHSSLYISSLVQTRKMCKIPLTFKLPWVTKTEFLLTVSIQYQTDKWWE